VKPLIQVPAIHDGNGKASPCCIHLMWVTP